MYCLAVLLLYGLAVRALSKLDTDFSPARPSGRCMEGRRLRIWKAPGTKRSSKNLESRVEAREVRPRAERMWLKKSVQAQSLKDPLDLALAWEPGNSPPSSSSRVIASA